MIDLHRHENETSVSQVFTSALTLHLFPSSSSCILKEDAELIPSKDMRYAKTFCCTSLRNGVIIIGAVDIVSTFTWRRDLLSYKLDFIAENVKRTLHLVNIRQILHCLINSVVNIFRI